MTGKYSLDTFYSSKEWEKLRKLIAQERVDADGNIICAHCGKPIVKAYDMIGHHKIALTEENVNDATISLNPENIDLVHHRCHNLIPDKFGFKRKEIYLVYGSPLSGKSTWVNENKAPGDFIVDMDSIWQCISGCDRYVKPPRLNAVAFATRDFLMEQVRYRNGKWNNAYIIGGFPLTSERERLVKIHGAREIYIDTTKEECLARLEKLEDGRDKAEWSKYISDWWRLYHPPGPD